MGYTMQDFYDFMLKTEASKNYCMITRQEGEELILNIGEKYFKWLNKLLQGAKIVILGKQKDSFFYFLDGDFVNFEFIVMFDQYLFYHDRGYILKKPPEFVLKVMWSSDF